jgi:hypothetical protein
MLTRRLPYSLTPGLKRRLLESTELSIGQIYELLAATNRHTPLGACRHWRKMAQLADITRCSAFNSPARPRKQSNPKLNRDLRILSWDGRRSEEIAYLERLFAYQADELVEVYKLAKEVSRRTKRVVLTLHNASLGAATGWGIPSFSQQIPDDTYAAFVERVNRLRRKSAAKLGCSPQSPSTCESHSLRGLVDGLFMLWAKRLVRPLLLQGLWALRVSLLLNDLPIEEWQQSLHQAKETLGPGNHHVSTREKGLAIALEPPAVSRQRLTQIMSWQLGKKKSHAALISLLWGLIAAGEDWLHAERFPHLVLPIIDKFFISSQRDRDLDYLPLFVQLAGANGRRPLFLLIDDTSRAKHPSLQLAMECWRRQHSFRGLGVFASDSDHTASPLEGILTCSSQINLFALRPKTQVHNPVSFNTLLAQRPDNFLSLEQYDSSWKDNLPFLYHGTQVAPLAGRVNLTNGFSPALTTSAGPMAFGVYYRHRLRQLALKRLGIYAAAKGPTDLLWREYTPLANLL